MRMPPKCPIGGSGDAEAAKAPEHVVEMEKEVAVTAGKVSLHPNIVDGVKLPQPEAEFHTDSTTTPAMTPTTTDSWLVIYTHLCVK